MLILRATKENAVKIFPKANKEHEPVIFPTDTIYGLGAFFDDNVANDKIFHMKNRDKNRPFPLIISNFDHLEKLKTDIPDAHKWIIKKFWPGKFTFILKTSLKLNYCTAEGKIAVRMIESGYLREVVEYFDTPLTATSANLSDEPYDNDPKNIISTFRDIVKYFLYAPLSGSQPSTVIDLTSEKPEIIRNPLNLDKNIFES